MKNKNSQPISNDESDTVTLSDEVYSSTGSRKIEFKSAFPTPQLIKSKSTKESYLIKENHINVLPKKKVTDYNKTYQRSNPTFSSNQRDGECLEKNPDKKRKLDFSLLGNSKKIITLDDNNTTNEDDKIYGLSDVSDFELESNDDSDNNDDDFFISSSKRNEFQLRKL